MEIYFFTSWGYRNIMPNKIFMRKVILFIVVFILLGGVCAAQCFVNGTVANPANEERLIGVYIIDTLSGKGCVSDVDGKFSLETACERVVLKVSYIGFETVIIDTLLGNQGLTLDVKMTEGVTLGVTLITAQQQAIRNNVSKAQVGKLELPMEQIKSLPVFLGELDILKSVQLMPGVQAGNEASAGFYVRGGASDQNLVLYDGVPVYNPFHAAGFLSIFNADVISDATVYKGGFPAQFGGRISSIIDVGVKNGNMEKWKFQGGIGLVTSRVTAEGPIIKDKLSVLCSFRAFYSYSLIRALFPPSSKSALPVYYFYDLNTKLHYKINEKQSLSMSYYIGGDRIAFSDFDLEDSASYDIPWRNYLMSLKWQVLLNDRWSLKMQAYYTRYDFRFGFKNVKVDSELRSGIQDAVYSADVKWAPKTGHTVQAGIETGWHRYEPNVSDDNIDDLDNDSVPPRKDGTNAVTTAFFIQHEWELSAKWAFNYGVRLPVFVSEGAVYAYPEPRFTAKYQLSSNSSVKMGYSWMNQNVHLLTSSTTSTPLDLWIPSSDTVKPQMAHQVSAGWFKNFKNDTYESSVEVFYKHLDNQIEYKEGKSIFQADNYEDIITFGKGWSAGAEFFVRKRYGRFNGFMAYTLSWSRRQFDLINLGESYFSKYDRRHDLSVALNYQFNENWAFSALFVFGSGNALTLPQGRFLVPSNTFNNGTYYLDYGKNSYKLQAFHRLDLGIQYKRKRKGRESEFRVDIYNTYSRQNPFFVVLAKDNDTKTNQEKYFLRQYSILPIVPSFTYNIKL